MIRITSLVLIVYFFAVSCSTPGQMGKTKLSALQLYQQGAYQQALTIWESEITASEKKSQESEFYTPAAFAALKLGQNDKALIWLKKASYSPYVSDSTFLAMADIYQQKDNLSLEMLALQDYLNKFPQGTKKNQVNERLFDIYVESANWQLAEEKWNTLTAYQRSEESNLLSYFDVSQALMADIRCDSIAIELLQINSDQVIALNWLGKKYYRLAEDVYQKEMTAYDQNKTRKQYAHLLEQLDLITADFKKSLSYLKTSYEVVPDAKIALYLSYIYNRLDDKQKASYYGHLAE